MQRIWRSKPTQELIKIMEESVDLRLYLIAEKGPLSFTFQDDKGKKFMINIGDRINCNCTGNKKELKEHCVHTIYVLNRIFKISFSDQLILQLQYSDSELNKMIETRRRTKNKVDYQDDSDSDSDEINKNKTRKRQKNQGEDENRMNLIDDVTCSICQEDMYFAEGLFFCEESCGHNFHLDCLKIWSTHKKANEEINITCPMCRQKWNDDKLKKQIVKNMANKKNIKSHKGISCKNCERRNIKGERFHCLICEDYNLCIECFNIGIHKDFHLKNSKNSNDSENTINNNFSKCIIANPLVIKKTPDESWHGFENNLLQEEDNQFKYSIKQIKFSQYLISLLKDFDGKSSVINNEIVQSETLINNINHNPIIEENHQETNSENDDSNKSNIEDRTNRENQNALNNDKNENEIKNKKNLNKDLNCIGCNKPYRASTLHLLKYKQTPICGHIIHIKCVEFLFKITIDKSGNFRVEEGFNICKFDNDYIFPGLKSLKFNMYKNNEETINGNNNNQNNQINTISKNNQNEFYVINANNIIQNFSNNNFPSSNQKNKIITGRVLSNKSNGLLAKMNNNNKSLFDNVLQINNLGLKITPSATGGKSLGGKLAPIHHTHHNIYVNDYMDNFVNKNQLQNNKSGKKIENQKKNNNVIIGLAMNIQKLDFDEENKIQNFERSTREKVIENKSHRLSAGKYQNSKRIINSLNKTRDKSSDKIINIKSNKEVSLPDLVIGITKYNNNDIPDVDADFLRNEIQLNEDILNSRITNKPRGYGIRTINQNNIGIKVNFFYLIKFLLNYYKFLAFTNFE